MLEAYLTRGGIADAERSVALAELASQGGKNRTTTLLALLSRHEKNAEVSANLASLLPMLPADEVKAQRPAIVALTKQSTAVRPASWAALAVADGSFDQVWSEAEKSPVTLTELLTGIPRLLDPAFRGSAWGKVQALLTSTPAGWNAATMKQGTMGRFVRIELPRRGTLTLAEVEVMSDGRNIARFGKASQSSASNGGVADRAIDGKNDGSFDSGTQTHTQENEGSPWWEVDLGAERPIESVAVWNRVEGELGKRLDKFTLTVLDGARNAVFQQKDNPAPDRNVTIAVSSDPIGGLRRAAIRALSSMGTQPEATFTSFAGLITRGEEVAEAARGLRKIPTASWPKETAASAATALVAWAKAIPTDGRTSQDYVETIQLASDLAGQLPEARRLALRSELKELRVAVFVLRTVREQMRYDAPRLVVEAGKPFEIILINDDFMPHNLVVAKPGGREVIGPMADKMQPDRVDAQGRAFVPRSITNLSAPNELILAATKMLEPGQQATLKITTLNEEGEYSYVCTFPGHWPVMWGTLIVTKDVEAYLQAHPVAAAIPTSAHQHGLE